MQFAERVGHTIEFQNSKEQESDDNWFYNLASNVKSHLDESKKGLVVPEFSAVGSIAELFSLIKLASESMWQDAMTMSLDDSFSSYIPKSAAGQKFIHSLNDKDALFKELANNRNWKFESLREKGDPEIWYALVLAVSEREQLKAQVLEQWVQKMTVRDEKRLGISKLELQIYAGLNLELQPNIDSVYVKQMMISGSGNKNSKNPDKYSSLLGSETLYIYEVDGHEKRATFSEVFPEQVDNINGILRKYAKIIRRGIKEGKLGSEYKSMPAYLSKLGSSLASTEKRSFKKIHENSVVYEKICAKLAKVGCPILVNPYGFVGVAGDRFDLELMVGLVLGDKSKWYQDSQNLKEISEEYLKERKLPKKSLVQMIHQVFFTVNGSNITYTSLASAGEGYIQFNDGRHIEVGSDRHERYHRLIKNGMTRDRFVQAIALGTMIHEFGHIFMYLDDKLFKKLGFGIATNKLEELKADVVGTILYEKYLNSGRANITPEEFLEQYLLNYLDDILDAPDSTVDKTPTWYAFVGKTLIANLLEVGAIDWVDDQFVILDAKRGLTAISKLGKEILDNYADPKFREKEVKEFVKGMENKIALNPKINQFLNKLYSFNL